MKKIQMVDLSGQYQEIKDQVNSAIAQILETSAFINGPEVHAFQKELETYLGVKHEFRVQMVQTHCKLQ